MRTIKNNVNIDTEDLYELLFNYEHTDRVKIGLYCIGDLDLNDKEYRCVELAKKWLSNNVRDVELSECIEISDKINFNVQLLVESILEPTKIYRTRHIITGVALSVNFEPKLKEYRECIRLYAYEDLNYKFKKFAKTFDLDNDDDLNVFLDFLTDNYPEALIHSREEYLSVRLSREYLKAIYQ